MRRMKPGSGLGMVSVAIILKNVIHRQCRCRPRRTCPVRFPSCFPLSQRSTSSARRR